MTIEVLIAAALALTYAMFHTKEPLLGFPSAIFWWIFGGYAYTISTATWDIEYFVFFASMFMGVFSALAAYAIRKRDLAPPDAWEEDGKYIDEEPDIKIEEPDQYEYIPRRERIAQEKKEK